jgi:hypothetical protein
LFYIFGYVIKKELFLKRRISTWDVL